MKTKKVLTIYVLVIIVMFSLIIDVNATEIMRLDDVKPAMEGIARTVFQGYKVEEFPVKIIDIVDQGLNNSLILFKASGEKIEEIGGIASGMSGSPVYVDGKLIGAIGYSWSLSDHRYGLITPIEDMLKLFDYEQEDSVKEFKGFRLNTPLFISGMQGRSFNRTKHKFEELGFQVLKGGGVGSVSSKEEPLQEGSAIAVQLVRGDINIAAIGTLTYKENGRLLAFGHPFTNKGDVDYLLSKAYINAIIPSIQSPFKLGSATDELIGSINIDRGAGVAGSLNKYPKIIPLTVRVADKDRDKNNTIHVQLVKDEDLLTSLITNVSLEAIDSTLDRIGKGTASVNLKITGKGLPDLGLERDNVFYSRDDIAAVALYELYELFNIITINPFIKVELIDIKVDIEISDTDNVALIQEVKVLNESIKPGDTLDIEVTLLPYRSDPFVKNISLELPDDINPGLSTMVIDGGFTGTSYQALPEEESELTESNRAIVEGYKDLDSILHDYLARARNNELIVQVYPAYSAPVLPGEEESGVVDEEEEKIKTTNMRSNNNSYQEIKELYPTDYVLEGSLVIDFNIEGEAEGSDTNNIVQGNR